MAGVAQAAKETIASKIWSGLAEGILSQGASMGFSEVLSLAGVDISGQAEINRKLDQIIKQLEVLQASVDDLRDYLKNALSELSYDVAVAPLTNLIEVNGTLQRLFSNLLKLTDKDQIKDLKAEINDLIKNNLETAVATWHNHLAGASGQTSVINAWGRAVYRHHTPVFGQAGAQAIQSQWDYFDAQQALSVMYLVNYYNEKGQQPLAIDTINDWQRNRKQQILLLRANVTLQDQIYSLVEAGDGKYRHDTTNLYLRHLPPEVIKVGDFMCCKYILPQLKSSQWSPTLENPKGGKWARYGGLGDFSARSGWGVPFDFHLEGLTSPRWIFPSLNELESIFSAIGATIGHDRDHFQDALNRAGFERNAGYDGVVPLKLWFANATDKDTIDMFNASHLPGSFIENDSWSNPATDADWMAEAVVFVMWSKQDIDYIFGPIAT
jgi:hypothetical protein